MQKADPPAYPISSVDNALRLLGMFREHERVRLSDAKDYLGVAHSTAHRLLAMLAYHDFVRQEADSRAYVAGPALVEIGLAAVGHMDIRALVRPVLEELAVRFAETVHLAVLEGGEVRYLDAVESTRALRVAARTGSSFAAHCTASGKALLAALGPVELAAVLPGDGPLAAQTPSSITSREQLAVELAKVRERGYAFNREESEEGVASVAAAIPAGRHTPPAALVISAPLSRLPQERVEEIAQALRAAAATLT
ncbi:IclR family transcriptional regulator [Nonomuraea sp. NPDC050556]|uniref:IclR family transcriptional regulator n=1 Tax=Nonomuraea sp. NPDC050556 TaxID=3364369 RepID=UPI0037B948C7